jgi:ribonuclease-3
VALKENPQLRLLQKELGYAFSDLSLLVRALTHVSYQRDRGNGHNEVLEFLGDAVLDLAVSDVLMRWYPDRMEGDLSRMRAALVNSTVLAEKAAALNLGPLLRLGKGEERSGGRNKESILAGAFEALLGAVYRDGGYEPARLLVERYFARDIEEKNLGAQDYKTRLQ